MVSSLGLHVEFVMNHQVASFVAGNMNELAPPSCGLSAMEFTPIIPDRSQDLAAYQPLSQYTMAVSVHSDS